MCFQPVVKVVYHILRVNVIKATNLFLYFHMEHIFSFDNLYSKNVKNNILRSLLTYSNYYINVASLYFNFSITA